MTKDVNEIEFDTIVAGVALVDDKVTYVSIDYSEQFADAKDGKVSATAIATKKQRGADYGLKGASETTGLGKEWFEQIAGVEEGLIGKTLAEVKEYFAGEEILSAATIGLTEIELTVLKAFDNLTEVKDVSKVGLGYQVSMTVNQGKVASVLEYAMLAVDSDEKIIKALLDTSEEKAEYINDAWTAENVNQTKGELKEAYGMLVLSEIDKEWFEQTDSLMDYLQGKTFQEVLDLNDNASEDEDLKTSVTYTIGGTKAAIAHAKENLKSVK